MTAPKRSPGTKERFAQFLDVIELTSFQKEILRQRWLDQVAWVSDRSRKSRRWYYVLRVPVVVGGVAIPGLVSLALFAAQQGIDVIRIPLFVISLTVAICAATEEIFNFGDRWRHYRRTAERLKTFGWQYIELNGPYRKFETHAEAFHAFTGMVEDILNEEVEGYLGQVATEPDKRQRHEVVG